MSPYCTFTPRIMILLKFHCTKLIAVLTAVSLFLLACSQDEIALKQERVIINSLEADIYEVSISEFREFIQKTSYTTTADSLDWSGFFDPHSKNWMVAENANWEKPDGRKKLDSNYPVTQVSYYDACAYCKWKSGRLPTAQEWDKIAGDSVIVGNIWEGIFPHLDEGKDGYAIKIAPRGRFAHNTFGLYDIFGNVWEWTSTMDTLKKERIIKGGSFLCDFDVCAGYIPSRYQTTPDDSGLNHLGFRCVYDKKVKETNKD